MHAPSSASDTLVSIIIPVFNGSRWLGDAIDSAIGQTHLNTEVIVVDDGSNDDGLTRAVAAAYGDQIRLITKPNGGVASALNAGIRAMRGSFFSWLSHDDLYHPRKIETQLARALTFPEPVVVFGDVAVIDETGRKVLELGLGANMRHGDHAIWHVLEARLSGCALFVPRTCFETCGVFDESLPTTQDYDLWYRMAEKYRFVHSSGLLTLSRTHSAQGSRNTRHLEEASLLWMDFLDRLPADIRSGMAVNELEFYARISRADSLTPYPGLSTFARRRLASARAQAKLTVVGSALNSRAVFETLGRLAGMGYVSITAVFAQHGGGSGAFVGKLDDFTQRAGSLVTVGADAIAAEIAAAVAGIVDPDAALIFPPDGASDFLRDLEDELDRLFAGEFDVMLRPTPETRWLDGAILRAGPLRQAVSRSAPASDPALRSELEFSARVAFARPPGQLVPTVEPTAAPADVVPLADDDAAQIAEAAPAAAQAGVEVAANVESAGTPTAGPPRVRYTRQFPPPYLGRFELLRVARKPFLKERNVERLLSLVEYLRTHGGGRLYRPAIWTAERLLGARGKIDREWYRSVYKDVDAVVDPVVHYLKQGWRENRDPSPSFSTAAYIRDVSGEHGLNPVTHASFYLEKQKDRPILGSLLVTRLLRFPVSKRLLSDRILAMASRLQSRGRSRLVRKHIGKIEWMFGVRGKIDREWYRLTYLGSAESKEDPSLHYLATGWRCGNKPYERYRIATFPVADGQLAHLSPLSRDTFLGRTDVEPVEDMTVPATEDLQGVEEVRPGGQDPIAPIEAFPPAQADPRREPVGDDAHGGAELPEKIVSSACIAFVPDGAPSSVEWMQSVRKALGKQARSAVMVAAKPDAISISGVGPDVSFSLPAELAAAVEHVRVLGIERFDLIGLSHHENVMLLLDGLSIPADVTVLSEPASKAERAVVRRAERVLTPDAGIALGIRQWRQRARILHVTPPGEREAFGYKVVRRRLRGTDPLRVLVIAPDGGMADVLDVGGLVAARGLPISLLIAAEPPSACVLQSVRFVGRADFDNLIELIGETAPNLLWLATDPDAAMLPYAQHVAEMGLPVLVTGSRRVGSRFYGRPFAWGVFDEAGDTTDAIVQRLEALRESRLDLPSTGLSPVKGSPVAFYPGRYLEWRKRT